MVNLVIKRIAQVYDVFTNPYKRFNYMAAFGLYNNLPDKEYLSRKYKIVFGKEIDWDNPKTFNEKLQWLKVYDRRPIYTQMVDKLEAKGFVSGIIGNEYIIPTIGVWNNFDEIEFDKLPNQFVLKCTHDSGGLAICRDKKKFDYGKAREKIEKSLKHNYFYMNREWPYKDVKPRIIAEKYMEDNNANELTDYKFFCFNGEPRFIYVSTGLENHKTAHISFLTMDWKFAPFSRSDYAPFDSLPKKPKDYELMIDISRRLSAGHIFLRVDLYEINGQVYFSELTFTPCAGMIPFEPAEYDEKLGEYLQLNLC